MSFHGTVGIPLTYPQAAEIGFKIANWSDVLLTNLGPQMKTKHLRYRINKDWVCLCDKLAEDNDFLLGNWIRKTEYS